MIQPNNFCLPKIIGHRGVRGLFPENTIESVKAAFNLGLECAEIDVKITKDKVPFLLHDDSLNRTTSGKGLANLFNYSDIKKLDAGYFFYNKKTEIYPPKLEDILEIAKVKKKSLNIELKPNINYELENVKEILKITKKYTDVQIYYSSFHLNSCIEVSKFSNNLYCGVLIDSFDEYSLKDIIDFSRKYNFLCCGLSNKIISSETIEKLKENKLLITVYSEQNITYEYSKTLWNIGVNSVFVDDPTDHLKF